MFERNSKLINKKFIQYLIPSILTIFAMQFASLLDGIIVGNLIGNDALSATSMVMPILYIIQTPGLALGVGGAIVVGMLLGKRDLDKAKKAFSACFIYGVGLSIIFAVIAPIVSRPLANLFAESLADYSYQYLLIYLITDPIITIALLIASFMAIDNNPKLASFFYIFSNVIKILSMFLFIKVFNWGLYGAALSTAFGYFVGFISLIKYIKSDRRMLRFTFKIKGTFTDLKDALKASSATAINLLLTAIQMFIINVILATLIKDDVDLVIFGLVSNMVFVFDLFAGGILGLIPTLCGILYGEKDMYSLKSVVKKIYLLNLVTVILLSIIIMIVPDIYSAMFGFSNLELDVLNRTSFILRIYIISFIPYELNKFSMSYYPAVEKNIPSYVTILLREAIIVLPLTIILLHTNGLFGYVLAQVINEWATVIITYIFVLIYGKIKNKGRGLFLYDDINYASYDISIDNNIDNASLVSKEIIDFANQNNVSNRNSNVIGIAAEELISNIIYYGYKKKIKNYIDVNLKVLNDKIILRIRDDGLPFDPTKYEFDEQKNYSTSGINLIMKLTNNVNYMRILNLNNTVIEIKNEGE